MANDQAPPIHEQTAVMTPLADKVPVKVLVKPVGWVAVFPVRYALANDYREDGHEQRTAVPKLSGQFQCAPLAGKTHTHMTLRRLRKGYLYMFNEKDQNWSKFEINHLGHLTSLEGKDWKKRNCSPKGLIYLIDDEPCWFAFSDAAWTQATLKTAQEDAAFRSKHMRRFDPGQVKAAQPHTCPLHSEPSQDARRHVADLHGATSKNAFWFSRHAFKISTLKTLLEDSHGSLKSFYHAGATLALEDPVAVAMDLATLMLARTDQFMSRRAEAGFSDPKVTWGWAATTASAIDACVESAAFKRSGKKEGERRLIGKILGVLAKSSSPYSPGALSGYDAEVDEKLAQQTARELDGNIAWVKAESQKKYHAEVHGNWKPIFKEKYLDPFDKDWILPLAEAHAAFMESAPLKGHFKDTFDPQDAQSGCDFTRTLAKCYAGVQDKGPCHDHLEKELKKPTMSESLVNRALVLNQEGVWSAIERESHSLKASLASQADRHSVASTWASLCSAFGAAAPGIAPYQKDDLLTMFFGIISAPMGKVLAAARNGTLHHGAIAVAVATGTPLECIKVEGTERMLRQGLLEFVLGKCPGVSKTAAKQFAATQIEYCKLKGAKLDGSTSSMVLTCRGLESISHEATPQQRLAILTSGFRLEEAGEAQVALKPSHGLPILSGSLGMLLGFVGACQMSRDLDRAMTHEVPALKKRFHSQIAALVGTTAETLTKSLEAAIARGWVADITASAGFRALRGIGSGLGILGGLAIAVMDLMAANHERKNRRSRSAPSAWRGFLIPRGPHQAVKSGAAIPTRLAFMA
ncbi:T6SS effector BTH_I2691 family protein [Holophaga foetida]|uniref:T6SS effector BTH_I2691 family protein n=1 Tax=Holophaga foetida TaxID=35839 RepID=UPI0002471D11|nr:T6SS effector BTH_I2691 family protein [Holophaga foetida]